MTHHDRRDSFGWLDHVMFMFLILAMIGFVYAVTASITGAGR